MQTEKYQRKTFLVDVVQVTEENMQDVANWCKGTIETTDSKIAEGLHQEPQKFIKVNVLNPYNPRQTQAFVGDWVLYARNSFKVYTDTGFKKVFEPVFKEQEKAAEPYRGNVIEKAELHSVSLVPGDTVPDEQQIQVVEEAKDETPVPTPPPSRTMTVND